jgi:curved DNA-binding protein CbpA
MPECVNELEFDWYAVLGCNSESTKGAIEKAARQLFLKYHPDKTNDAKAPELFLQVQKAKEILLDDSKRKIIDEAALLIKKRNDYDNERSKNMDGKRKRMRDNLEELLKKGVKATTFATSVASDDANRSLDKSKAANIERLRKEGASLRETSSKSFEIEEKKNSIKEDEVKAGPCLIKVKWRRDRLSHSDDSLAILFATFGDVEAVTMIGDKGNAATILFSNEAAAAKAVASYAASTEYKVVIPSNDVNLEKKRAAIFTHTYASHDTHAKPMWDKASLSQEQRNEAVESELSRQTRRAIEREDLIRSLSREESFTTTKCHNSNPDVLPDQHPPASSSTMESKISDVNKVGAPTIVFKEADVLRRMAEAAKIKKLKLAEAVRLADSSSENATSESLLNSAS